MDLEPTDQDFLNDALDVASAMDPDSATDLAGLIGDGSIGVGDLTTGADIYGAHDSNTIAIDPTFGEIAAGATLLHEFEHLMNSTNPLSEGEEGWGEKGEARGIGNDCFECTHAQMDADTWTDLAKFLCLIEADPDFYAKYGDDILDICKILVAKENATAKKLEACPSPCPTPPYLDMADWFMLCVPCKY